MSLTNKGTQNITFQYQHPATGNEFNTLLRNIIKPGVYQGQSGLIEYSSGTAIKVNPFSAILNVGTDKAIAVQTAGQFTETLSPDSTVQDYFYATYTWASNHDNYLDFDTRATSGVAVTNELILGTINYGTSGLVTSVNTNGQSKGVWDNLGNLYAPNSLTVNGNSTVTGNSTVSGNSTVTGSSTVTRNSTVVGDSTVSGVAYLNNSVIINELGLDKDFRVESQTSQNLLFTDASTNRIGINTNNPSATLNVAGATILSGVVTCSDDITILNNKDLKVLGTGRIEHDGINVAGYSTDGTVLRCKIIDIGDWDMDATSSIDVAHGLTLTKIRNIIVTIRNDTGLAIPLINHDTTGAGLGGTQADTSNVSMWRTTGGLFDGTAYNSTSYNRGWIIIWYVD